METTHPRHTGQSPRPRPSEIVRRALDGAVEFRRLSGFDRLFAPHAHDYPVIGLVREGRLEEALYLLVGALAIPEQPDPCDGPEPRSDAAHAMAAYLRRHVSETVRLEEVASAAGLDKYRALRSFTASFGLTPMRYLASLRVGSAREALAGGASCAEAALAAGFADQAHMTRAFKERLGMTPGFYQRAIVSPSPSRT